MLFAKRAVTSLAACAITAIGLSVTGTAAANAAAGTGHVTPGYAIVCGGDTCIQTASISGSYANVRAWANTTTFFGHFQLVNTGCGTTIATSPNQVWPAGGAHYTFVNIFWKTSCGNSWRITGWKKVSPTKWDNMGSADFSI
jgi:hypothetical protein